MNRVNFQSSVVSETTTTTIKTLIPSSSRHFFLFSARDCGTMEQIGILSRGQSRVLRTKRRVFGLRRYDAAQPSTNTDL